ncbi:hypothetical protein VNI00_003069 [Paramarasmius palmivorus]|uniref:Uncharacterized protein n=1 Tax=Paramarasmius palmivorus TaxID=297713 RepID=A0AAW0DWN9_9AGAR
MVLQASYAQLATNAPVPDPDQLTTTPARIRRRSIQEDDNALHCDVILWQMTTSRENEGATLHPEIPQYQQQFDGIAEYLGSLCSKNPANIPYFVVLAAWRDQNDQLQTQSILPPRHRGNDHLKLVDEWKEMSKELPLHHIPSATFDIVHPRSLISEDPSLPSDVRKWLIKYFSEMWMRSWSGSQEVPVMPWSQIIQYPAAYFHVNFFRLLEGIQLEEFTLMTEDTLFRLSKAVNMFRRFHRGGAVFNTTIEIGITLAMLSVVHTRADSNSSAGIDESGSDRRRSTCARKIKDRSSDNYIDGGPPAKKSKASSN